MYAPSMRELHALSDALEAAIQDTDGEITAVIETLIEQHQGELESVAQDLIRFWRYSRAMQAAAADEKKRADRVITSHKRREQWARSVLRELADKHGRLRADGALVYTSSSKPRAVVVDEERIAAARPDLMTRKPQLDRRALLKALESGVEVPGAELEIPANTVTIRDT